MEEASAIEEQPEAGETALVLAQEPTRSLTIVEERESPQETKVTGIAGLWLLVSTILFTLSVYIPIYLLLSCIGLFIVLTFNTYLFFGDSGNWNMASAPMAVVLGIGGVIVTSMLVGLGRALTYSEEEKLKTSVRELIFTVLLIVLSPLLRNHLQLSR